MSVMRLAAALRRRARVSLAALVAAVVVCGVLVATPAAGAGSVSSSVSLNAPASGVYNSTIQLAGIVWRTGRSSTRVTGATVYLQRSVRGSNRYGTLASARTNSTGTFVFSVRQTSAYDYRAYYPGSATYARSFSPARYPVTTQNLLLDSIATTDAETGQLTAKGRVYPAPPAGTVVYLQRLGTDPKVWTNQATGRTSGNTVTVNAVRPGSVGSYRLVINGRYPYGAGISTSKTHSHYVWRDALSKSARILGAEGPFEMYISAHPRYPGQLTMAFIYRGANASSVTIRPNIQGCIEARHQTANAVPIGFAEEPARVTLGGDVGDGVTRTLPRDTGEVTASMDLTNVNNFFYSGQLGGRSSSFNLLIRMQLRCIN